MNWKTIVRNIGFALLVSALFMLLSAGVSVLNGNDSALAALLISFTITFICGVFPFIFVRSVPAISLKEGYVIITLSWLLSFIFGMLPYALWGGPIDLGTAWFESVSGYTTTGSTALANVESLPESLLFWRSSTHFIGGLGVVVFLFLVVPDSSPMRLRLSNMEQNSFSKGGNAISPNKTVFIFAWVYLGIFLASFLSYWIAGMSLFDAVCHAMSVVATGGFSTRNMSISAFDSRLIEGLTMFFMYVSSLHFGLVFLCFVKKSLKPLKNPVTKFYTFSVLAIALVEAAALRINGTCPSYGNAIWSSMFQTLSISSTTGFAIIDNVNWPLHLNILLIALGIMCGCAGSTSGGLKADRILILFKAARLQVMGALHPNAVANIKIGGHVLRRDEVYDNVLHIGLYGIILVFTIVLSMFLGIDGRNSFAASISSLSNVGPAIGELGYMGNFSSIPDAAKFIYTLDMFLGRVEIYPVLSVIAMIFDRHSR